jgi:hypothetical protein
MSLQSDAGYFPAADSNFRIAGQHRETEPMKGVEKTLFCRLFKNG